MTDTLVPGERQTAFAGQYGYGFASQGEVLKRVSLKPKSGATATGGDGRSRTRNVKGDRTARQATYRKFLDSELETFEALLRRDKKCSLNEFSEHHQRLRATERIRRYYNLEKYRNRFSLKDQLLRMPGKKMIESVKFLDEYSDTIRKLVDVFRDKVELPRDPEENEKDVDVVLDEMTNLNEDQISSAISNNLNPCLLAISVFWLKFYFAIQGHEINQATILKRISTDDETQDYLSVIVDKDIYHHVGSSSSTKGRGGVVEEEGGGGSSSASSKRFTQAFDFNFMVYANWLLV